MPDSFPEDVLAAIRSRAESHSVDPDAVVAVVAELVEMGALFGRPAADLSPEAQARIALQRFSGAAPKVEDDRVDL